MIDSSGQKTVRTLVTSALESASFRSRIDAALAQGRELNLKTVDGQQIRISTGGDTPVAAIIADDIVLDDTPSGKFVFGNGKCIVVEKGRLVGGDDFSTVRRWALFALLPEQ
jgi:hypothetical protein